MKCEYDNGGCTAPIPVKCSDDCIIRELKAEIKSLEEDIEECNKEYLLVVAQNKAIKEQHKQLLREINLTE